MEKIRAMNNVFLETAPCLKNYSIYSDLIILCNLLFTRRKARFARLPLDWAEKIWFCVPACRSMSLSAILCSKR